MPIDPMPMVPWWVERIATLKEEVESLKTENKCRAHANKRLAEYSARLRVSLGDNTPHPVWNVLERLADVTDHLLDHHSCDRHGYEGDGLARDAARALAKQIRAALAGEGS